MKQMSIDSSIDINQIACVLAELIKKNRGGNIIIVLSESEFLDEKCEAVHSEEISNSLYNEVTKILCEIGISSNLNGFHFFARIYHVVGKEELCVEFNHKRCISGSGREIWDNKFASRKSY